MAQNCWNEPAGNDRGLLPYPSRIERLLTPSATGCERLPALRCTTASCGKRAKLFSPQAKPGLRRCRRRAARISGRAHTRSNDRTRGSRSPHWLARPAHHAGCARSACTRCPVCRHGHSGTRSQASTYNLDRMEGRPLGGKQETLSGFEPRFGGEPRARWIRCRPTAPPDAHQAASRTHRLAWRT